MKSGRQDLKARTQEYALRIIRLYALFDFKINVFQSFVISAVARVSFT